jgi:hypothetical protein
MEICVGGNSIFLNKYVIYYSKIFRVFVAYFKIYLLNEKKKKLLNLIILNKIGSNCDLINFNLKEERKIKMIIQMIVRN